ncbi:MAG: hypothetical protein DRH97_00340 [Chloroflexi bacterium]|nr:MAG: hypothetical protein DRH97_00340 [Chloroflexota bacterium]
MDDRFKFRGKRIDNGEWIIGSLVILPNGVHRIHWQPFPECTTNTYHAVEPKTVSQCTGLKDKNGKLIFEGDKVQVSLTDKIAEINKDDPFCFDTKKINKTWTVEWVNFTTYTGWRLYGENRRFNIKLTQFTVYNCELEIIGNMYEEVKGE